MTHHRRLVLFFPTETAAQAAAKIIHANAKLMTPPNPNKFKDGRWFLPLPPDHKYLLGVVGGRIEPFIQ